LADFILNLDVDFDGTLRHDTPLIDSGLLDSLAILQLAGWIESEVGHPLDPDGIRLPDDWNTIERIVTFVSTNQSHDGRGADA
jgi:acyl carrier protein